MHWRRKPVLLEIMERAARCLRRDAGDGYVHERRKNFRFPTPTPRTVFVRSPTGRETQLRPEKLQFLQLAGWDKHNSYDEEIPSCLHYTIEWKVTVNNRVISKDAEQDLVLAPTAFWHMYLRPKLENLLREKVASNRLVRCDDTTGSFTPLQNVLVLISR